MEANLMKTQEQAPTSAAHSGAVADYLEGANGWDEQRVEVAEKRAKDDRRDKYIAFAIAGVLAIAMLVMQPLKETRWITVLVDVVSGAVEVKESVMSDAKTTYPEEVMKYWVKLYVRTREKFTFDEYDSIYRTVGLMSSPQLQQKWFAEYNQANPKSPAALYGDAKKARVKIVSFSWIDKNKKVASVRYLKSIEQPLAEPKVEAKIATVTFRFVNPPTKEEDREVNPVGFQVVDWSTADEAVVGVYGSAVK